MENDMINFINKTPNAYICIKNIKEILLKNNFEELYESEEWNNLKENGKYFVIRNDSSLIAFSTPKVKKDIGFNIVSTHTDSPCFLIKPNADIYDGSYLKLNVYGYGGMINYSWLDRPLSISGRIITKYKNSYEIHLLNIEKDLLLIPSQAIHINANVNNKNELKIQDDMLPFMAIDKNKKLKDILKEEIKKTDKKIDEICDYDLYLYNRDKGKLIGLNNEFILSPRLDDLSCLYPALISFINAENKTSINLFCAFNNEEIGSLSFQGADSTFLIDVLTRISNRLKIDMQISLNNSFIINADNTHASHPNAKSKNDPTNIIELNKGVAISHHASLTTDALTSSLFKGICESINVPYQDYTCNSNLEEGSTLGSLNQRHVGISSVDIGLPELAMHSANEIIGTKDVTYLYKCLLKFYNTTFKRIKNKIKIIED